MISAAFLMFIICIVIAFSIQNVGLMAVSFLAWRFETSVSAVTVGAVLAGILIAQLLRTILSRRQEQNRKSINFISRRRL
jgi:uncharacterized integral membrane protein